MKDYVTGSAISNDLLYGRRIGAASEEVHFLIPSTLIDFTYGFVAINLSEFKMHPITSESFWFDVGEARRDAGEDAWDLLNKLEAKYQDFNITYFAENTKTNGSIVWQHSRYPSNLLNQAYNESSLVYDGGKLRVWELRET